MAETGWHKSWAEGRIGFHRSEVHGDLVAHAERFLGDASRRVLVPLCGKTRDIPWLMSRGHHVVGVELVPQAVEELHRDNDLSPRVEAGEPYTAYRSDQLTVLCGDVLALTAAHAAGIERIWDRAALVALDRPTRARYVDTLRAVAPGATVLLNAFDWEPLRTEGPPFAVPDDEVRSLYAGADIEVVDRKESVAAASDTPSAPGVRYETTYLISL